MKTPSLGCHLDTIVALTASPRVACFAQMPSFLLPIFICVYVFMCGCRVLIRKACEDIKREKREGFVSQFRRQQHKKNPLPRERESEREREREEAKNSKARHQKIIFSKKKREVFSTRTGLFCLRARTRELISHKHATQTLVYARNH